MTLLSDTSVPKKVHKIHSRLAVDVVLAGELVVVLVRAPVVVDVAGAEKQVVDW